MDNIMLDLETMGKGPNAAIVAFGAVEFDLDIFEIGRKLIKYMQAICLELFDS